MPLLVHKNSLKEKLKQVYLSYTAIILLAISIIFMGLEVYNLQKRDVEGLHSLASVLSANSTAALSFNDKAAGLEILEALSSLKEVDTAILLDKNGALFSQYSSRLLSTKRADEMYRYAAEHAKKKTIHKFSDFGLYLKQDIRFNGELIGSIHIFDNLTLIKNSLVVALVTILFAFFILLFVSYFIAIRFQRIFADPIIKLKKTMDVISHNKEYDVNLTIESHDEIEDLYYGFNTMIKEINTRDIALAKHNLKLESEIQQRTREIHLANETLGKYFAKAQEARVIAEDLAKAKSLFLANMSHEIRTPLNGIIGIIDILSKTALNEKQNEYIDIAKSSSDTLLLIINDILDYSKVEANRITLEVNPINLYDLVEQLAMQFSVQAHKKGIELYCFIDPTFNGLVKGDALRIKQILSNVLSNAVKFTEKGGVTISCYAKSEVDNESSKVVFEIKDTGVGIHSDNIYKIFDSFSQEDQTTTRKYGGTGLGLSISKMLVELMNGSIKVESILSEGTTFTIELELQLNQDELDDGARQLKFSDPHIEVTILDFSKQGCSLLHQYIQSFGVTSHILSTSDEIEQELTSLNTKEQIYLIDYEMPDNKALKLCSRLNHVNPNAKIILLHSIWSDLNHFVTSHSYITNFLSKPVSYKMLYESLNKALHNQDSDTGSSVKLSEPYKRSFKILVAEDYEINQKIIQIMLEAFGCSVKIAQNGVEVVECFKDHSFDLIFMDCQMPVLDGFGATRQIRDLEHDASNPIPIVALTGNVTEEDIQACYNSGMSDFVRKPYAEKDIIEMIDKWAVPYASKKDSDLNQNLTDNLYDGVVDLKQYQKIVHLGNDSDFSEKIFRMFHESTGEKISYLLQAHDDKNFEEVRKISHMLKTSCANMGASKLALLFKELEQSITKNELSGVEELINQLHPIFQKTIHLISSHSGQNRV